MLGDERDRKVSGRFSFTRRLRRRPRKIVQGGMLAAVALLVVAAASAASAAPDPPTSGCQFPNPAYHHVVWLQFDNVHLRVTTPTFRRTSNRCRP